MHNDAYVGDKNILLYTREEEIANKVNNIMNKHSEEFNNKDFIKKSIELFHLLTYLDLNEYLQSGHDIIPNEPGDFLVVLDGKEILYEIVTVFGDKEAKLITDLVKGTIKIKDKSQTPVFNYPKMNTNKLSDQFKRILDKKKDKSYFLNYEKAVLLLVTSEHDRCGTSPWYLVEDLEDNVRKFIKTTASPIKTMNYFSSRKNGNPTINDIEDEINLYNECFNKK